MTQLTNPGQQNPDKSASSIGISSLVRESQTFRVVYEAAGGDQGSGCIEVQDSARRGKLTVLAELDFIGDFGD
jgi:hypothetical protein